MSPRQPRTPGQRLLFEYHCLESHKSADANLWYHSHQPVTVLHPVPCDGDNIPDWRERTEAGCPLVYRVRWDDGLEIDVLEDELLDSAGEYQRPDPPTPSMETRTPEHLKA